MDSFEINKILGAVLFTCLCLLALNIGAGAIFTPAKPEKAKKAAAPKAAAPKAAKAGEKKPKKADKEPAAKA